MKSNLVKLQSSDGTILEVPQEVIEQSKLVKSMLADCDGSPNEGRCNDGNLLARRLVDHAIVIPVPNVNGPVLARVIDYCKHHLNDKEKRGLASALRAASSKPSDEEEDAAIRETIENITEWDQEFLKVDQGTLFDLILAANYLDIQPLLNSACYMVANMMKGKSVGEIRKTFNVKCDFTPEEEAMVIADNQWCEDI
ncbi:hypothetical protein EV182_000782 [Spiromyces aspiralis]|uniref:Uncharacterized protein n=1 Tax=Spiromyces aspiralis TaxID=68401 RepID=A0ACC1HXU3_9FUNG|nr:hypothetical protein EV182_000782 [Spiromyces aspiralis]